MEFLKSKGFSDEEIEALLNKYSTEDIELCTFNQDNILEVIDYLKDYGIKDVPKLMLERLDIFYLPYQKIEELFSKYEKESVITSLEYDSTMFDEMI